MIGRERKAFDAYSKQWVTVIAWDLGKEDDTTIPIDQHPSTIGDLLLNKADTGLFVEKNHKFRHGQMQTLVSDHLRRNGPSTAREIADSLGTKPALVNDLLSRNQDRFKRDGLKKQQRGSAIAWVLAGE